MVSIANSQDIKQIIDIKLKIQKEAWGKEYNIEDKELITAYNKYFLKHLNKDCYVFTKKINNNIVALSILLVQNNLPYCKDLNNKYGYITSVNTLKEHRNKGYQHEIMKYLIDFAKKKKLKTLKLDSSNPVAINIYKKYNFKIYEEDRKIMILYL